MEKTSYQENRIQQQEQQLFDSETKTKIQDSLQEIYNKQYCLLPFEITKPLWINS